MDAVVGGARPDGRIGLPDGVQARCERGSPPPEGRREGKIAERTAAAERIVCRARK